MTYRGFLSRADIGLRSPRSVSHNITPENGGVAGHYAGPAQNVDGHDDCLRLWRGYQVYHMDTHGWVDIAYTLGVCDHGYILAGRGAGVRTAANGTNIGNQNYYAVCWIGGKGETPTQDAVDAFWAAVRMLREQGEAGNKVVRHSYFKSTSCPGNLGTVIDKGPQEETMPDRQDNVLEKGDRGNAVAGFQRCVLAWAKDAGHTGRTWTAAFTKGDDGVYDDNTVAIVQAYQKASHIQPTGKIDGTTAALLARYITDEVQDYNVEHDHEASDHTHDDYASKAHGHNYASKTHTHTITPESHDHASDGTTIEEVLQALRTRLS